MFPLDGSLYLRGALGRLWSLGGLFGLLGFIRRSGFLRGFGLRLGHRFLGGFFHLFFLCNDFSKAKNGHAGDLWLLGNVSRFFLLVRGFLCGSLIRVRRFLFGILSLPGAATSVLGGSCSGVGAAPAASACFWTGDVFCSVSFRFFIGHSRYLLLI